MSAKVNRPKYFFSILSTQTWSKRSLPIYKQTHTQDTNFPFGPPGTNSESAQTTADCSPCRLRCWKDSAHKEEPPMSVDIPFFRHESSNGSSVMKSASPLSKQSSPG